MADRRLASSMRLLADLPTEGLSGTVTLVDALGQTAGTGNIEEVGGGRYVADITITDATTRRDGVWTATWEHDQGTTVQRFTVGDAAGTSFYEVKRRVASQVLHAYVGRVSGESSQGAISDLTLIGGGGDHIGKWVVVVPPNPEMGLFRRVVKFDGSALQLAEPFAQDLAEGERYLLLDAEYHPDDLDQTIRDAVLLLAGAATVKVVAQGLVPDDDGILTAPAGWSHVSSAINGADSPPFVVPPGDITLMPGRRIRISTADSSWSVALSGMRPSMPPVWDDSLLDLASDILIPLVSHNLHLYHAAGAGMDYDDHLRRASEAFQSYGVHLATRLPRPSRNARLLID